MGKRNVNELVGARQVHRSKSDAGVQQELDHPENVGEETSFIELSKLNSVDVHLIEDFMLRLAWPPQYTSLYRVSTLCESPRLLLNPRFRFIELIRKQADPHRLPRLTTTKFHMKLQWIWTVRMAINLV